MKIYVLDSFALLAFLQGESGAQKVRVVLDDAIDGKARLLMSVVNWGEVRYILARRSSTQQFQALIAALERLPIEFVPVDIAMAQAAADIKTKHPMSYADCFAGALAIGEKGILLTGDPEFRALSRHIDILWV